MYIPYFQLGCVLEINSQRTAAYLANVVDICGNGSFRGTHSMTCDCPPLHWLIPDDGGPAEAATYTTPASDQAPWVDGDIAESSQFLGFVINDVTVNAVTSRSITTRVSSSGGGVVGPRRNKERRFDFTVLMFACNESAMEYGFRFLTDALGSPGCDDGCTLCDGEYRDSCPTVDGSLSSLDKGRWILKNVAAVEGPTYEKPPVEGMQCNVRMVKFSLVSEYPWKFKCPVDECIDEPLATFPGWAGGCTNAEEFFCEQQYAYCSVSEPLIIGETGLVIKIKAGSVPLQHIDIAITPDKFGYECNVGDRPAGYVPLTPCDQIQIPIIPAGSTLIYDTSIESVTLELPGGGVVDGTPYISTKVGKPPTFPTIRCGDFCIRVGVSECSVQGGPTMSIQSVHREL